MQLRYKQRKLVRKFVYIVLVAIVAGMFIAFGEPFDAIEYVSIEYVGSVIAAKIMAAALSLILLAFFLAIFDIEELSMAMLSVGFLGLGITALITSLIRGGTEALYQVPIAVVCVGVGISMIKYFFYYD